MNQEYQILRTAEDQNMSEKILAVANQIYTNLQKLQREASIRRQRHTIDKRVAQLLYLSSTDAVIENSMTLICSSSHDVTSRKLLSILNIAPQISDKDQCQVLKEETSFLTNRQSPARELLNFFRFQSWLKIPYSATLLINGNGSSDEKVSPLSYACATLIEFLDSVDDALIAFFFCGLHTGTDSLIAGPVGMMKSLITQLVRQYSFNLDFIHLKDMQAVENNVVRALCDIFLTLVSQIPPSNPVFCIIDGISFFETASQRDLIWIAMSTILDLVEKANVVVKVLITAPGKSAYVMKGLHKNNVIWLSETRGGEADLPNHRFLREATALQLKSLQSNMYCEEYRNRL